MCICPESFEFHASSMGLATPARLSASRVRCLFRQVTQYAQSTILPSARGDTSPD
jgi:hypothetical protein